MKQRTIKLVAITAFLFLFSKFSLPVKAASSQDDYSASSTYLVGQNYDSSERYVTDNPVPEEYQDEEFIIVLILVSLAIMMGTGRSIKYLRSDRKIN